MCVVLVVGPLQGQNVVHENKRLPMQAQFNFQDFVDVFYARHRVALADSPAEKQGQRCVDVFFRLSFRQKRRYSVAVKTRISDRKTLFIRRHQRANVFAIAMICPEEV